MNLQDIILEWIGEDKGEMVFNRKLADGGGYPDVKSIGYNEALSDLRERVPELVQLITESEILGALRELRADMTRVEKSIDKLESPDYD